MDIASDKVFKFCGSKLTYIDYVLVYNNDISLNESETLEENDKAHKRELFHNKLIQKGLFIDEIRDKSSQQTSVLIQSTFPTLCNEAERLCLRMPINTKTDFFDDNGCCDNFSERYLVTDNEEDFLSATFHRSTITMYRDYDKEDKFFRPGLRFLLTYSILINADIDQDLSPKDNRWKHTKALQYLHHTGVYSTHFVPHSPSKMSKYFRSLTEYRKNILNKKKDLTLEPDDRKEMHEAWIAKWRYQPLWKIRNYFGEKTAFYFAWSGHMTLCLWGPMIFGLLVFFYGLYLSINHPNNISAVNSTSDNTKIQILVENMLTTVKQSFDNIATPFFAGIICIWGTIFAETWKRLSNRLAFEWDVASFDKSESERPAFVGTDERQDPVSNYHVKYFPMHKKCIRFIGSVVIILSMLLVVFGTVISIIVYRVVVTVNVCPGTTGVNCLMLNMVLTSVLNAIAIIALGKLYDRIAIVLTNWENHRTQSDYDNALVFKLFFFQFVNSYSSLFYIAFFKGQSSGFQDNGIFDMGSNYIDTCGIDNNCMSMLSFQVLILMIMKPLPKFLIDMVLPVIMKTIKKCKNSNQVFQEKRKKRYKHIKYFLLDEVNKPELGDFTIPEYMEKVIQYGYLVLFAASFPLAPLFAFLTVCLDIKVDGYRLLWMYRRSTPEIVENIGIWQSIVETLNLLGVISTVLIIAFTSAWGSKLTFSNKLIFVLVAEHCLFLIKYILNVMIPDVPESVKVNMMRETFHFNKQREIAETIDQMK